MTSIWYIAPNFAGDVFCRLRGERGARRHSALGVGAWEMRFPYGKAPLWILVVAVVTGLVRLWLGVKRSEESADLVFALFAPNHEQAYKGILPEFEREHGVKIQMQLVHMRALQSRLQAAMLTGAEVPDVVEIITGSMGYFTRGPLEDVGFVDLTQRLHDENLYDAMVESRYSLWSSRGHIFALPHDVHPVALCYRRDLVEELGINVDAIQTWADFVKVGRRITKDLDGDGAPDRYAIDLLLGGGSTLALLVLQRGGGLFDAEGRVTFDSEIVADTIMWHVRQTRGETRIAFQAGWGQSLAKTMIDGLVLFYFCPDWRTKMFEMDVPGLKGKLALMPLPAWEPGSCRTSTWGGTGITITKACENQDLAWEFAKFLYLRKEELGRRFAASNIIPPLKEAWDLPEFTVASDFYSGRAIGQLYAGLAPSVPAAYASPYSELADGKLSEAYMNAADYYDRNGEEGLKEYTMKELERCADYVRKVMDRNVFLKARDGGAIDGD